MEVPKKALIVGLAGVLVGLSLATMPWTESPPPASGAPVSGEEAIAKSHRSLASRLSAVESRLRRDLSSRPISVEAPHNNSRNAEPQVPASSEPIEADAITLPEAEPSREELAALNRQEVRLINAALAEEPLDPDWTRQTELEIENSFRSAGFDGSELVGSTCGSTFCRTVAKHTTGRAQQHFEGFLTKVHMSALMKFNVNDAEQLETVVYFLRGETDRPDHPVRQAEKQVSLAELRRGAYQE